MSTTIVGGGIGGFTVASELRARGYDAEITIIDPHGLPYDRPPLSKEILSGEKNAEQLLLAPRSWYEENNVHVKKAHVARICGVERQLYFDDGTAEGFDNLVIATGGVPRALPTPGFDDPGLFVLRTTEDAVALKNVLGEGVHLAIIGAGLIGAEVASSAQDLGAKVTLVDPAPVSLVPAVGEEIAARLHDMHADHGVEHICGLTTKLEKTDDGYRLHIDGERTLDADHVLLAVGIVAEEELAQSAELECDGGVLVDHEQRTSMEKVWAVGDCARLRNADGSLERRHEHWESAVHEAQTAAASIMGDELPQHGASWFWTDRYGTHVEGIGSMTAPGTTVIRPDAEGKPSVAFRMHHDGRMAGCASVNDGMAVRAARRIIDRGLTPDQEALADPAVPLKKLAK